MANAIKMTIIPMLFLELNDNELYKSCAITIPINTDSKTSKMPSVIEYSFTVSLIPSSGYIANNRMNVIPPPNPLKYFLFIPL